MPAPLSLTAAARGVGACSHIVAESTKLVDIGCCGEQAASDGMALSIEPGSRPKASQLDIMLDGSRLAGCLQAGVCLLPTLAEQLRTPENSVWQTRQASYQDVVRSEAPVQNSAPVDVSQELQDSLGVLHQGGQGRPLPWQQMSSRGWEPTVDSLSTMGRAELGGGREVRKLRWAGPRPNDIRRQRLGVGGAADTAAVRCRHSWQADCLLGSKTVGRQANPGDDHGADPDTNFSWHVALNWLERCRYLGQQAVLRFSSGPAGDCGLSAAASASVAAAATGCQKRQRSKCLADMVQAGSHPLKQKSEDKVPGLLWGYPRQQVLCPGGQKRTWSKMGSSYSGTSTATGAALLELGA
ncbi:MAG: hypothetical protein FRX49_00469 [Trebouxia sp. A1-2]|nr:MAG: hypothetical protein FRX49_00469 [Trebouxia sp. A1-2]